MAYLQFTLWFIVIHIVAYFIAGFIDLQVAKRFYGGKGRDLDFLRDMADPEESRRVMPLLVPSQVLRGMLMSVVLYPILGALADLTFGLRFAFFAGMMFVYADFASAIPFSNTIEGFIYMKHRYMKKELFWTIQFEAVLYSLIFGAAAAWFLF